MIGHSLLVEMTNDTRSKKIRAAGVLPFARDCDGQVWFLLGRERPNPAWGNDTCSWSEFGGSLDAHETPEQGAAREFCEETMGVVFDAAWMERELQQNKFLFALDSKTPSGKGYRSYVKQIPFLDYPAKFARFRTLTKKDATINSATQSKNKEKLKINPACAEKTSLWWFSVAQMREAVCKYKQTRHDPHVERKLSAYEEPNQVPHIRRGFAMDFDHLLKTDWAKNGFPSSSLALSSSSLTLAKEDKPKEVVLDNKEEHVMTPHGSVSIRVESTSHTKKRVTFQIISQQMPSPKSSRPRSSANLSAASAPSGPTASLHGPPILTVDVQGYSFHKKKKRRKRPQQKYRPPLPHF